MPATRRLARTSALAVLTAGLTLTTLTGVPAHARDGRDAVALSPAEVKQVREQAEERAEEASEKVSSRILLAQQTALAQRGDAYSYGAAGPDAFDCSGLVYYSYRRAGFDVPRTSGAQAAYTRRVARNDMRAGDLMFFYGAGGVYHAAVFLRWDGGRAVMVHAPGTGQSVTVASPWTDAWFGGTLR